jgi:hypothetical protein
MLGLLANGSSLPELTVYFTEEARANVSPLFADSFPVLSTRACRLGLDALWQRSEKLVSPDEAASAGVIGRFLLTCCTSDSERLDTLKFLAKVLATPALAGQFPGTNSATPNPLILMPLHWRPLTLLS